MMSSKKSVEKAPHYRGSFFIETKRDMTNMFRDIHRRYDFFNHLFSLGGDKRWRRKSSNMLAFESEDMILDFGAGTGDFSIAIKKTVDVKVIAIDLVLEMLKHYRTKITDENPSRFSTIVADGELLPFLDDTFDGVVAGFIGRNLFNLEKGLSEIYRVLRPGGKVGFLEFCRPKNSVVKLITWLYYHTIISFLGNLFLSKKMPAYSYLVDSIENFLTVDELGYIFSSVGFTNVHVYMFNFGTVALTVGGK